MKNVIVIGAGLGGLVAGAKLAKHGYSVTVVEKHYVVGGCATIFKRKSVRMEVSLHQLDGLDEFDLKSDIFNEFGTLDEVELVRIDEFYSVRYKDRLYKVPTDAEQAKALMRSISPSDSAGIEEYFDTLSFIRQTMCKYMKLNAGFSQPAVFDVRDIATIMKKYRSKTVGEFLDDIIESELVKKLLVGNFFFYTDDVYDYSLVHFAVAQSSYIEGGAYYIKGGSQILSNHLANIIKRNNGNIILKAEVKDILTSEGEVCGVRYWDIRAKKFVELQADIVVANASVPHVVNDLIEKDSFEKEVKKYENRKPSCSLSVLYMVVSPPLRELGNQAYTQTIGAEEEHITLGDLYECATLDDIDKRMITVVDYSQVESGLSKRADRALLSIAMVDYLSNWDRLTEEQYYEKKQKVTSALMDRLEALVPGSRDAILDYELGTPKTIVRYTNNHAGALYGFAQTVDNKGLRSKSLIKNLFYASAWMNFGGGFTGAMSSGYMCAMEVMKEHA